MPLREVNGIRLLVEEPGSGDPLVLVYGSWDDQSNSRGVRGDAGEHNCKVQGLDEGALQRASELLGATTQPPAGAMATKVQFVSM